MRSSETTAKHAALAAAIRLLRDVGITEKFTDVHQDTYSKNRLGKGPTKFYENAKVVKGDAEDVDRITERGADALLKSIEEPAPRTVWILCAPTVDDVVATIRSRCRLLTLQTPSVPAVARLLESRDGIAPELAAYAAQVSQGHIGRARALARDEDARERRQQVLQIPFQLHGLGACLTAAA